MNPVLSVIGNMFSDNGGVGSAQANSTVGNSNKLNEILGIFSSVKNSSNSMEILKSMSNSNPLIKQAFDYVDENGGNMQKAFYALSEKYGVDPQNILRMIK